MSYFRRRLSIAANCAAAFLFVGCGKDDEGGSAEAQPRTHVYEYGERVSFGYGGEAERFEIEGWSGMEPDFTWTDGPVASLGCRLRFTRAPTSLHVKLGAMLNPPAVPYQDVEIALVEPFGPPGNYTVIGHWQVNEPKFYDAVIPEQFTGRPGETIVRFEFHIAHPMSPAELHQNGDQRKLGLRFYELVIDQSSEPPPS